MLQGKKCENNMSKVLNLCVRHLSSLIETRNTKGIIPELSVKLLCTPALMIYKI